MLKVFLYRNGKREAAMLAFPMSPPSRRLRWITVSCPVSQDHNLSCVMSSQTALLQELSEISSLLGEQGLWLSPSSLFNVLPWHAVNPFDIWLPLDHLLLRKARSVWRYLFLNVPPLDPFKCRSSFKIHYWHMCFCYFYALAFLCGHVDNFRENLNWEDCINNERLHVF